MMWYYMSWKQTGCGWYDVVLYCWSWQSAMECWLHIDSCAASLQQLSMLLIMWAFVHGCVAFLYQILCRYLHLVWNMSGLYHSLEWYTQVMSVCYERLWYYLLISWSSRYGQHGPTNSAMNWSCFSGVGYGTLFYSRHCVERQEMKVGHEIIAFYKIQ